MSERRKWFARWAMGGVALATVACSPTFDWRDVRPAGSDVQLMFPCKPVTETRSVALAGQTLRMTMVACQAGGSMFGLAFTDTGDPSRVPHALAALREAQAGNLRAPARSVGPVVVVGASPVPAAERFQVDGRFPDGTAVRQHLVYFARGTRVYQVAVMGEKTLDDPTNTFFEGVRLGP